MKTHLIIVGAILATNACSSAKPYAANVVANDYYLCCNLRFNHDGDATDANYAYSGGGVLAAGSRVTVTKAGQSYVYLSPVGEQQKYYLELRFGTQQQSPAQYFAAILRDTDPRESLETWSSDVQDAVRNGRLAPGMTKEQVLMARGYPPYHRTPGGVESDEWLYYDTRARTTRIRFEDGKLVNLQSLPAP